MTGRVDDLARGKDLTGRRLRAQAARRQVERPPPISSTDDNHLARIRPRSANSGSVIVDLPSQHLLQLNGRAHCPPRRTEHREHLVATKFDDLAAVSLDGLPRYLRELRRQPARRGMAILLTKPRVATQIRDQDCLDLGRHAGTTALRLRLWCDTARASSHPKTTEQARSCTKPHEPSIHAGKTGRKLVAEVTAAASPPTDTTSLCA